jgi:hypothetical protein
VLGKVHKVKVPGELPPGRPICSHVTSPTRRASLWLDWKLTEVTKAYCSELVKDTTDFLVDLESFNETSPKPKEGLLLALDVISLYPNINIAEGLEALKHAMSETRIISG